MFHDFFVCVVLTSKTILKANIIFFCSKFCVRKDFLTSPAVLKKRLVFVGISMLILSPCLVIFPLVYLILRHAEEIYNHPSTASSRRWSNLSRWILESIMRYLLLQRYYYYYDAVICPVSISSKCLPCAYCIILTASSAIC